MAEGFEQCLHVPQQSRRDKLRVAAGGTAGGELATAGFHGLLSPYDRSLLPSDLLSCSAAAATDQGLHNYHFHPLAGAEEGGGCRPAYSLSSAAGEGEGGFRSLIPPASSFSTTNYHHQHHSAMDPLPQVAVNPSCSASIHGMSSTTPFLYPPQNLHNYSTLSLSLSSHGRNNLPDDNLIAPLELNLHRYGSTATGGFLIPKPAVPDGGGLPSIVASRSSGLFDVYSSILKGSRFLKPTQQLLDELCDGGRQKTLEKMAEADSSIAVDASAVERYLSVEDSGSSIGSSGGSPGEIQRRKSRLVLMLEEVCRRYKQYYQQMQDVVASFEYLAGFGNSNSAPFADLALKAMSKHFRCLKNAITDQLQLGKDDRGNLVWDRDHSRHWVGAGAGAGAGAGVGVEDGAPYGQRPLSSLGYIGHQQPVWRPQRGLPERAVAVLKAWLFEHFLHPYPTDADKIMLAKQAGLSRSQVSNWFINARVRLWKPMVEEIHMLETQQAHKASNSQKREHASITNGSSRPIDHPLPLASDTPSTSTQSVHETPSNKRTRNDLPVFPTRNINERHHNIISCNLPSHPSDRVSVVEGIGGLNGSVSLTLGLHQSNKVVSLPAPFQAGGGGVQRFGAGLDGSSGGFVLSGYEGQERQFGRDIFGGPLLHDFAG